MHQPIRELIHAIVAQYGEFDLERLFSPDYPEQLSPELFNEISLVVKDALLSKTRYVDPQTDTFDRGRQVQAYGLILEAVNASADEKEAVRGCLPPILDQEIAIDSRQVLFHEAFMNLLVALSRHLAGKPIYAPAHYDR